MKKVIVDSNILFSALLRAPNRYADTLLLSDDEFYAPKFMFVELFKHKERIADHSKLPEELLLEVLYRLVLRVNFFDERHISTRSFLAAFQLVRNVDLNDLAFLALHFELSAQFWTSDMEMKKALTKQGFSDFYEP